MNDQARMARAPDRFAEHIPERRRRKWDSIVSAFMEEKTDELRAIQRGGSRGRIFACLVKQMLQLLDIDFQAEPVFDPISPATWWSSFARQNGLKLRRLPFYNPDFLLADGTWLEATLSENRAYQKLFVYGHQAGRLKIVWLDEDSGLHKEISEKAGFPIAQVLSVGAFYPELEGKPSGVKLIQQFERLRRLKGRLL